MWDTIAKFAPAALQAVGSFLGSSASAVAADSLQKGRTDYQKEADLDLMRKAPSAQMQGLRDAGLNPMLAYGKLDFGGSAPGPMGSVDFVKDYAALQSSDAAISSARAAERQADTAADVGSATVSKIKQEIEYSKTDQERVKATTDNLRVMRDNLIKEGYNLTEVGNKLDAEIRKLRAEIPLLNSRTFLSAAQEQLVKVQAQLGSLDVQAASDLGNLGREAGQLKPLADILRALIRR